jgi:hypothetical protein
MGAKKNPTTASVMVHLHEGEMNVSADNSSSVTAMSVSLAVPLLLESKSNTSSSASACGGADVSKSEKLAEQIKVNRLLSFLFGSLMGVFMQFVSVIVFTRIVLKHREGLLPATYAESGLAGPDQDDAVFVVQHLTGAVSAGEADHHRTCKDHLVQVMVWLVYHLSLAVYLLIWFAMMTLAISKVGWRCISSSLSLRATRRTCFLKTFFFINGFVQGSLMPWIFLELYIGNPSFDVYWMPTTHLMVFFAVVYIYDWMADPTSSAAASLSVQHRNHCAERYGEDIDDDDDDGSNFLV